MTHLGKLQGKIFLNQVRNSSVKFLWIGNYLVIFVSVSLNSGRYFTKKHEWVEVSDDKSTGAVGISSYAQEALGDVVFVQLPDVDEKVELHFNISLF